MEIKQLLTIRAMGCCCYLFDCHYEYTISFIFFVPYNILTNTDEGSPQAPLNFKRNLLHAIKNPILTKWLSNICGHLTGHPKLLFSYGEVFESE